jgi:tetratricopeptide (TPR) repeat protein
MIFVNNYFLYCLSIILFSSFCIQKETDYEQELLNCKNELNDSFNSISEDSLIEVKSKLLRLQGYYPDSFLVHYYTALSNLYLVSFYQQNGKMKKFEEVWYEGMKNVEQCVVLNENLADGYILRSQFYGYKIYLTGYKTASQNNRKIKTDLELATRLESGNPRIYMAYGINYLYTPQIYGGSLDSARSCFEKALRLFPKYKLQNKLSPDWGIEETYVWLGKIAEQDDDVERARLYYLKALEINSSYLWAQYQIEQLGESGNSGKTVNLLIWIGGAMILLIIVLIVSKIMKNKLINN